MNKIILSGRMTADAKAIQTAKTRGYSFSVAVNRMNGDADFFNCVVFDQRLVDVIEKEMQKGRFLQGCFVELSGRMSRGADYTDKNGQKRHGDWSVTVDEIQSRVKNGFEAQAGGYAAQAPVQQAPAPQAPAQGYAAVPPAGYQGYPQQGYQAVPPAQAGGYAPAQNGYSAKPPVQNGYTAQAPQQPAGGYQPGGYTGYNR